MIVDLERGRRRGRARPNLWALVRALVLKRLNTDKHWDGAPERGA